MLEFSSTVLPAPSPYYCTTTSHTNSVFERFLEINKKKTLLNI